MLIGRISSRQMNTEKTGSDLLEADAGDLSMNGQSIESGWRISALLAGLSSVD
ncbi:MAG: hypothetical protein KAU47_00215 [Candidatus Aminicenantes bacterium]|nr:hypothetical protein [Candidatus Aminicenantes bacterium]MCK4759807.1 hypothetical protein [Candidatus Aminicenantes bacterium]